MAQSQTKLPQIRKASVDDLGSLKNLAEALGSHQEPDYFETVLDLQNKGERDLMIISEDRDDVGFGIFNRKPRYKAFRVQNIPCIQDLNIAPLHRRKGYATKLILYFEDQAKNEGNRQVGIGVGLYKSYGAAQRLYVKLGYIPDAQGVAYDCEPVKFGEFRPIDDDLCLMLTKDLA